MAIRDGDVNAPVRRGRQSRHRAELPVDVPLLPAERPQYSAHSGDMGTFRILSDVHGSEI